MCRSSFPKGKRGRHERITLGERADSPSPPPLPAEGSPATRRRATTRELLGWVSGGAGVAAVGVGAAFGFMTHSAVNAQRLACSTDDCGAAAYQRALSDQQSAATDATVSEIAFAAGGALLATSALLFLLPHSSKAASPTASVRIVPSLGANRAVVFLTAQF